MSFTAYWPGTSLHFRCIQSMMTDNLEVKDFGRPMLQCLYYGTYSTKSALKMNYGLCDVKVAIIL
jgi:hypothetical protein